MSKRLTVLFLAVLIAAPALVHASTRDKARNAIRNAENREQAVRSNRDSSSRNRKYYRTGRTMLSRAKTDYRRRQYRKAYMHARGAYDHFRKIPVRRRVVRRDRRDYHRDRRDNRRYERNPRSDQRRATQRNYRYRSNAKRMIDRAQDKRRDVVRYRKRSRNNERYYKSGIRALQGAQVNYRNGRYRVAYDRARSAYDYFNNVQEPRRVRRRPARREPEPRRSSGNPLKGRMN